MSPFDDLKEDSENWEPVDSEQTAIEADNYTPEEYNHYLTADM